MTTIEERVSKLLSLASSANEHEAAAAAEKAAELIDKYNLDRARLGKCDESPIATEEIWTGTSRTMPSHIRLLSAAVDILFGTHSVYGVGGFPVQIAKILAVGRAPALRAARQALITLPLAIETSLAKRRPRGRTARHSYRLGAAESILWRAQQIHRERERRNAAEETSGVWGLVKVDAQATKDAYDKEFPDVKTAREIPPAGDALAALTGATDGREIALGVAEAIGEGPST